MRSSSHLVICLVLKSERQVESGRVHLGASCFATMLVCLRRSRLCFVTNDLLWWRVIVHFVVWLARIVDLLRVGAEKSQCVFQWKMIACELLSVARESCPCAIDAVLEFLLHWFAKCDGLTEVLELPVVCPFVFKFLPCVWLGWSRCCSLLGVGCVRWLKSP